MPWRPFLLNPAGGQKSRRHSFFEKGDRPPEDSHREPQIVEPKQQSLDAPTNQPTALQQPSRNVSPAPAPAPLARTMPDIDSTSAEVPMEMRNEDPATGSRSHRFSLLRFRHASDPQLSRSYAVSASGSTPPLPQPSTPTIVTTAPTAPPLDRNAKMKDKLKLAGRSQNPPAEHLAVRRKSLVGALDAVSESDTRPSASSARNFVSDQTHVSFEQPDRLSALSARGAPPAYGEVSNTSLPLPPSRVSESSRSDASSGDHGIYAETTTTHTVSTTTTFFRLPRRKKDKGHLFPLPVKIPPPGSNLQGNKPPRLSRAGRTSTSPGRRSPDPRQGVAARPVPELHAESDSEHPSPLISPTHSTVALNNAPLGSPGHSVSRKDSITSYRSAKSTPSIPMPPPSLGSRGRSSTMGSLNRAREAERQSSPQVISLGRTSTSTSGRKSLGDIFSLSHRLRQNSEPPHLGHGTPGTPASSGSKPNSFQIPREPVTYPERAEGDTPATYLSKLEEAVNRGVIAAILCQGFDDFSKTCLRKYMRGFSYFGDSIDMAVRKMLMEVELPKETQQIDRLLQGFADRYCECNPGIFESTGEAYFVAFSILLLHSDTHNKNNKRKMQKNDYVKNTQDQVEVSQDILECFYDNVSYTPFIHFEDEVAINSHRLAVPRPKKGLFKTPSSENLRGPVDPYALILDRKLELLRPSLKDVMNTEDTYSCASTGSSSDADILYQAFHKAGVLQIVSARSRPDAFLSQATISNPAEAQVGLVDIKAAKVGLLWRKDPKKKKARSPWQEWGALLTGSQLYFFRDVGWVKNLISQHEAHQKSGSDANPVIFKPPLASFQPDALLSMDDAVALLDFGYKKHKNAFLFIKHGGFEEVFLANHEGDTNDWVAKLNYAATFRTTGVRMRGFIGANYEGQRPVPVRGDSTTSGRSIHTARGASHMSGRQIDQQLAGEILAYRRQIMTDKIIEADEKLVLAQKELENLMRNARHLQICSPIQGKTREALVLAAGRMSAKLKWTRVEMWRTRCHRDVLKMDLEQEIGSSSAANALRESTSLRSTPQKKTPLKLSHQSLSKSESKKGDEASSPKSVQSIFSSHTTSQAALDWAKSSEVLQKTLSDGSIRERNHLSVGSVDQPTAAAENSADTNDRASSSSIKSHVTQSLNHRPSLSSSQLGRSDAGSVGQGSRPNLPSPGIDDEERLLRDAGLLDNERAPRELRRPDSSESDRDLTSITSPDALSKDRTGTRRSLHRTLRDSQHSHQSSQSLRHRKAKEASLHHSPAAALRRSSQGGTEGLARGTGSFTVHGRKASVVNLGSEWQSLSNEDRTRPRKQAQTGQEGLVADGDSAIMASPKPGEVEDTQHHDRFRGAPESLEEVTNEKPEDSTVIEDVTNCKDSPQNESKGTNHGDHGAEDQARTETISDLLSEGDETSPQFGSQAPSEGPGIDPQQPGHLSVPSSELRRSPTPQAVHA